MSDSRELQICLDSPASARAAECGGADSIELCCALESGGLTPSAGLIERVLESVTIPVDVLVRPRAGGFAYREDELDVIRRDVEEIRRRGAAGVVIGWLDQEGQVEARALAEIVELARPLRVTFHRAFDVSSDLPRALEDLARAGVDRVLTSGGAKSVREGQTRLGELVDLAAGRLRIIAGSGVRLEHVGSLVRETGLEAIHVGSACREKATAPVLEESDPVRRALLQEFGEGGGSSPGARIDEQAVREFRRALDAI